MVEWVPSGEKKERVEVLTWPPTFASFPSSHPRQFFVWVLTLIFLEGGNNHLST
jgi:hypothetical protein